MGSPHLQSKEIYNGDVKLADVNISTWERTADDWKTWSIMVRYGMGKAEETRGPMRLRGEPGGRERRLGAPMRLRGEPGGRERRLGDP